MKKLIKKILKESDFDWVSNIDIDFGQHFNEDDLGGKIILDGDTITYDLGIDELFKINGRIYEDYHLSDLILHNGTYVNHHPEPYENEDNIDYYPQYLKTEQQDRLRKCIIRASKILNLLNDNETIDSMMSTEFSYSEEYLGSEIYTGPNDWVNTTDGFLDNLRVAIEKNRYEYMNGLYLSELDRIPFEIEGDPRHNTVSITTRYPHKTSNGFIIYDLTDILKNGLDDLFSRDWNELFYDGYEKSGSEVETRKEFEQFINKIETSLDGLESEKS